MGSDEDWFARVRGLKPGEPANFVYARDFDANEVELQELPPDLLEKIQSGEESLSFKGAPDDEAVLCTSDRTFLVKRVETSNTLLVMQPAGGIDRTVVGDAEGEDDRDLDHASDGPTPKRRRRDSAAGEGTPAAAENGTPAATAENGTPALPDLTAYAEAASHLELVPTEPKLDAMWLALRSPPHAYAGADVDRDADAAWAASLDDTEFGEEGVPDAPPRGFTLDELDADARASRAEIQSALDAGPAFRGDDGRWRGIDEEYLEHAMDIAVVTAQGNGWELGAIPGGAVANAMIADGFPAAATAKALAAFCSRAGGGGDDGDGDDVTWSVDAAKLCAAKASRVLDEAPPGGGGGSGAPRWRLDAFLERWRSKTPEDVRGGCVEANLRGLALVDKAADGGGGFVRAFRASQLPRNLKERFAAIFAFKPRWTLEELEPYLEATADATVEAQLLKYTRVSQPNAKATATYSKR
jgi:sister chromatid cohesion protein DCC1